MTTTGGTEQEDQPITEVGKWDDMKRPSVLAVTALAGAAVLAMSACAAAGTPTTAPATTTTAVATTTTAATTTSTQLPPFGQELQNTLDGALNAEGAMGVSLAVMVPGYRLWVGVGGMSGPGEPITGDMAFGVASVTKSFMAALVLQLAEEDWLSLDDPLREWLPYCSNVCGAITIKQLLNHTSGTYSYAEHPDFYLTVFGEGDRGLTDEEMLGRFVREPYFAAGAGWHYSNTGYTLLGMIVEEATNSTVSAELRDRFFDPLGLTTAFFIAEEAAPGEVAEGWLDVGRYAPELDSDPAAQAFSQIPWTAFWSAAADAGGVFASAEDLAKWAQALFGDQGVLRPDSLREMLDFIPIDPDTDIGQTLTGYGLGVEAYRPEFFDGARLIGHSGSEPAYKAASLYLPEHGASIGATQNFDIDEAFGWVVQVVNVIINYVEPAP